MKKLVVAALVATLSTSTAFAADLIIPTEPMAYSEAGFDWSGFYAGANLGYGWAEATAAGVSFDEFDGILGGVQAGYNHDFGGFILGVEADAQLADIFYEETIGGVDVEAGINAFGTLRARAGLAVDRFMPYVTGGLAVANANISAEAGGLSIDEDETYVGWTIGAGVEGAITDNVTLKAEYLYLDLGEADFDTGTDIEVTSHVVRLGVNYKF